MTIWPIGSAGETVLRLIVAVDEKRGLADDHGIPWQGRVPADSAYFRDQTAVGTILMGFRTYDEFDQPLHGRENFVVSRAGSAPLRPGFVAVEDLESFVGERTAEPVWVIGGAGLYAQTFPLADELFITRLEGDFGCTKFFPEFAPGFRLATASEPDSENGISYRFEIWRRRPADSD